MLSITMSYDIRHLRAFVAVAETLSFRAAAERAHLAQPAVSRTIRDLEDRLGAKLFERDTHHVSLTEAGTVFLEAARVILAGVERARLAARAADAGRQGRLAVGYMDFATHRLLPAILPAFKAREPDVTVDLIYMPTERQRVALLRGEIDIGLMIGPFDSPGTMSLTLETQPLLLGLPNGHPLARRSAPPTLEEAAGEPMVLGAMDGWSAFRAILNRAFEQVGAAPRVVQEASTTSAIFAMVGAGMGLTIHAGEPSRYDMAGLTLRAFAGTLPEVATVMSWRPGRRDAFISRFVAAARMTVPA
jgi:DNA-binding transcriptional LysR family regulator